MKLTDKELEIMALLWRRGAPMTATEIIEASENRTWKDNSIFVIMNTLIKKKAVTYAKPKPTSTNSARSYAPAISLEDYMISKLHSIRQRGLRIDKDALIKGIREMEEG